MGHAGVQVTRAGSGAGAEEKEDAMDAALVMLTRLMDRMDVSDAWQTAMGEDLRAFYAAVPTPYPGTSNRRHSIQWLQV